MNLYKKHIRYFLYILTAVVLANAFYFVSQKPVFGYANNFDFLRQSACVGLWQYADDKPREEGNGKKVYGELINDGFKNSGWCQISSGTLITYLNSKVASENEIISISRIGITLVVILALGAIYFLSLSVSALTITALFSIAFAGVFLDFKNLLFFNTLYLESTVTASIFFSIFFLMLLFYGKCKNTKEVRTIFFGFIVAVSFLGFSKEQYLPLGCSFLLIAFSVLMLKNFKKLAAICLVGLVLIPSSYYKVNKPNGTLIDAIVACNKTNTFLGAVLPNAKDKIKALDSLGLPQSCNDAIGLNWYSPGLQQNHPCPEVLKTSRVKLLNLFLEQPAAYFDVMNQGVQLLKPFGAKGLSFYEGDTNDISSRLSLYKSVSLSYLFKIFNDKLFLIVNYAGSIIGIVFILTAVLRPSALVGRSPILFAIGIGGLVNFYSIFSSVFGDGFVEVPRHAIGVLVAYSIYAAAIIVSCALFFKNKFRL